MDKHKAFRRNPHYSVIVCSLIHVTKWFLGLSIDIWIVPWLCILSTWWYPQLERNGCTLTKFDLDKVLNLTCNWDEHRFGYWLFCPYSRFGFLNHQLWSLDGFNLQDLFVTLIVEMLPSPDQMWPLSMESMEWMSCRLRGGTDSERRRRRLRVRLCRSKRTGGAVCVCVTSLRSPWSYSTGHEPWTGDWECSTREIGLKGAARIRELQINLYAHSNPLSAQIEESCCITKWKQASDSSPDLSQFHVA